ncbi:hypothetical protein N5F00_01670 [Pseudomonas chengduensis]|nr:hypothetical protein [Pseudomonas chengduensis]MDH1728192.1 hypothetical protein [Pseudomonas chengduensis]
MLFELALPFAQQAFRYAERLGDMTKRRAGKHLRVSIDAPGGKS